MGSQLGNSGKLLFTLGAVCSLVTIVLAVFLYRHATGSVVLGESALTLVAWLALFLFPVAVAAFRFVWRTRNHPTSGFLPGQALQRDVLPKCWWWIPLSIGALFITPFGVTTGPELWQGLSVACVLFLCSWLEAIPSHIAPAAGSTAACVTCGHN